MKRIFVAMVFFSPNLATAIDPVSVYAPTPAPLATSLNQSLPQALQQAAPQAPPATLQSVPSWNSGLVIQNTAPTYLNAPANCDVLAGPQYALQPGCGIGPSLSKPYLNLLSPPTWFGGSAGCETCSPRGGAFTRLRAWLGFQRTPDAGPALATRTLHAPLMQYFPCNGTGSCSTGSCATGNWTPGRPQILYTPLSARMDVAPTCSACPTPRRANALQRLLGVFGGVGSRLGVGRGGSCATGNCGVSGAGTLGSLGSQCDGSRSRYANPMSSVGPQLGVESSVMPAVPQQPAYFPPSMPVPTAMPTATTLPTSMPAQPTGAKGLSAALQKLISVKSNVATQPLTNP